MEPREVFIYTLLTGVVIVCLISLIRAFLNGWGKDNEVFFESNWDVLNHDEKVLFVKRYEFKKSDIYTGATKTMTIEGRFCMLDDVFVNIETGEEHDSDWYDEIYEEYRLVRITKIEVYDGNT